MSETNASFQTVLNLKAGEWVEVRSREEILATLDPHARLEGMPFMPEMLQFCGRKLRVSKRSDKTCQYIAGWSIRRMKDSVHLENVRCDGSGHDGCEAGCLIFWKEAWLKRAENGHLIPAESLQPARPASAHPTALLSVETILAASRSTDSAGETIYSCQETDVLKFSSYMRMWDPRQYIRDLRSGNLASGLAGNSRGHRVLETMLGVTRAFSAMIIGIFNEMQMRHHGVFYPFVGGTLEKTPKVTLNLQPGELVQVRTKEEIMSTLDKQSRNRGLLFDYEMLTYCGSIFRVLRRVYRIVDAKTGKMLEMKNPCIVLEGVAMSIGLPSLVPEGHLPLLA